MRPSTYLLRQLFKNSSSSLKQSHGILIRNFSKSPVDKMRFVQYSKSGGPMQLGAQILQDGDIFDLSAVDSSIPNNLVEFLQGGPEMYAKAQRIVACGHSMSMLSDVHLLPPITKPDKVACVGLNFKGHCTEQDKPYPKEPMIFSKFPSTIVGPYDHVMLPTGISKQVDFEAELVAVIGKEGKCINEKNALDYVFGYTIAQDISARDWQRNRNNGQFLMGKSMDTFCPLGPCVVTKDKIRADDLTIKCWLNGKLMQDEHVSDMVFSLPKIIAYISQAMTFYPGDIILTGTPAGVGANRKPPIFLKKGDLIETEIEGIGKMKNRCQ